ncbi:unnamed protein product [Ambrosiozyma monospora]|uniref:Unnamed protein product n=1 Tax=Ambrosiozyma monospora TaxID=43982 RepID=A0ACB5TAU8_AMBMO|nr:unnamed protein product [Ambrosiozyma monospora]
MSLTTTATATTTISPPSAITADKELQSQDTLIELSLTSDDYVDQFLPLIKSELSNKNSLTDLINKLEENSREKEIKLEDVSLESIDDLESSLSTIKRIAETSKDISGQVNK